MSRSLEVGKSIGRLFFIIHNNRFLSVFVPILILLLTPIILLIVVIVLFVIFLFSLIYWIRHTVTGNSSFAVKWIKRNLINSNDRNEWEDLVNDVRFYTTISELPDEKKKEILYDTYMKMHYLSKYSDEQFDLGEYKEPLVKALFYSKVVTDKDGALYLPCEPNKRVDAEYVKSILNKVNNHSDLDLSIRDFVYDDGCVVFNGKNNDIFYCVFRLRKTENTYRIRIEMKPQEKRLDDGLIVTPDILSNIEFVYKLDEQLVDFLIQFYGGKKMNTTLLKDF